MNLKDEFIKLGQALKAAGLVESGAEAKEVIQEGKVLVNGEVESRRGKKLYAGDLVTFNGEEIEFTDVLDELSGILLDEEKEAEPTDSREELKLTFHRNTEENSTVELVFYQYNGSYCISVLNGEETNCVDRESVVDLKEAVNSVILDTNYEE